MTRAAWCTASKAPRPTSATAARRPRGCGSSTRLPAPSGAALRRGPAGGLRPAVARRPAHIVKNLFRHRQVRYRGLAKNTGQLRVPFALAKLYLGRGKLLSAAA